MCPFKQQRGRNPGKKNSDNEKEEKGLEMRLAIEQFTLLYIAWV